MKYKKLIYSGIIVLAASVIIGILGTLQGILSSFEALKTAEIAGIGPVGSGIESAIYFTIFSIIGSIIGIVLIVSGIVKQRRNHSWEKMIIVEFESDKFLFE